MTPSLLSRPGLPVGYHTLHPDVSLNFQMNRCFGLVGDESMLDELRTVAPRITTHADWHREFAALAQQALAKAQVLKAAYYLRSAEFFLLAGDPRRKPMREKFVQLVRDHCGMSAGDLHRVPYADGPVRGFLPAYRFTPARPKGVVVFCGGFDSYLEELFPFLFWFRDAGYDIVAFEGPGQGGAGAAVLPADRSAQEHPVADRTLVHTGRVGPEPLPGRQLRAGTSGDLSSDHVQLRPASPPHPDPLPRVQGRGSLYALPLPLAGEGWGEGELVAEPCR